ncbi:MAG: hypothetical protein K2I48_04160 [Muribaculaceae bacterium]|nr:hypothetical protein [Muribaculaceae bacterium]
MAKLFHYKCTKCSFEIFSTPWGGDIYGLGHGYELFKCNDCKSLVKVEKGYTKRAIEEIRERHEFELFIDLPTSTKCRSTNLSIVPHNKTEIIGFYRTAIK